ILWVKTFSRPPEGAAGCSLMHDRLLQQPHMPRQDLDPQNGHSGDGQQDPNHPVLPRLVAHRSTLSRTLTATSSTATNTNSHATVGVHAFVGAAPDPGGTIPMPWARRPNAREH